MMVRLLSFGLVVENCICLFNHRAQLPQRHRNDSPPVIKRTAYFLALGNAVIVAPVIYSWFRSVLIKPATIASKRLF